MEVDQLLIDDVKEMVLHGESQEDIMQQLLRGENLNIEQAALYYELAKQAIDSSK